MHFTVIQKQFIATTSLISHNLNASHCVKLFKQGLYILFLIAGNALSCKETFSLLYYEFDAATREPPPWDADRYKLVGKFHVFVITNPHIHPDFTYFKGRIAAGEGRFNSNSEVNINTEVKSIPVTKKGVYFAFRDQGACISLLAIKVLFHYMQNMPNSNRKRFRCTTLLVQKLL